MATGSITATFTKVGGKDSSSNLRGYDEFVQGTGTLSAFSSTAPYAVILYGLNFEALRGLKDLKITGLSISFTGGRFGTSSTGKNNHYIKYRLVKGFKTSYADTYTSLTDNITVTEGDCVNTTVTAKTDNDMPGILTAINGDLTGFLNGYTSTTFGIRLYLRYATIRNITVTVDYTYSPPTITVTTSASPPEGGTVTGGGVYEEGAAPTLTAIPNSGYKFSHWLMYGSDIGETNEVLSGYKFYSDTTITAVFEKLQTTSSKLYYGSDTAKSVFDTSKKKAKSVWYGKTQIL